MGVVISNKLGQKKNCVKSTLDLAQNVAEQIKKHQASKLGIYFEVRRLSDVKLYIDIGNCETLSFEFKSVKDLIDEAKREGHSYEYAVLTDNGKIKLNEGYSINEYPHNEIFYSASFCKTQYSKSLVEHKWVAELTRVVASRCIRAEVNDEGDYYHSGKIEDAGEAIAENGALIDSLTGQLGDSGFDVVMSHETKIKSKKKYYGRIDIAH